MVSSRILLALLAALVPVAQGAPTAGGGINKVKTLPNCSVDCIELAMAEFGCQAGDYACACSDVEGMKKHAKGCVMKKCGVRTIHRKVMPAVKSICENAMRELEAENKKPAV